MEIHVKNFDRVMEYLRVQNSLSRAAHAASVCCKTAETPEDLLSKSIDGYAVSLLTVLPEYIKKELAEGKDNSEAIAYLERVLTVLGIETNEIDKYKDALIKNIMPERVGKLVADFQADPIEDYVLYIMDLMEDIEAGRDVTDDIDRLVAYISEDDMYSDVVDRLELAKHKLEQGEIDVALHQLRVAMELAK
jgi:hypothetical protein